MKLLKLSLLCILLVSGCSAKENNEVVKVIDSNPPWINVKTYVFETTVGNPINYETAYALDDVDLISSVDVEGYVNFNKVGEYYLKYVSMDSSGNISEEPFTVIVSSKKEEATVAPDIEILNTCTKANAVDENKSCDYLISDVEDYTMIFQKSEGKSRCNAYGTQKIENGEIESYLCEELYRNDKSIWGYGLKIN